MLEEEDEGMRHKARLRYRESREFRGGDSGLANNLSDLASQDGEGGLKPHLCEHPVSVGRGPHR